LEEPLTEQNTYMPRPAHWSVEYAFQLAEDVLNNPGRRVKRQHVVSKTVLGNYVRDKANGPFINMVDLRTQATRRVATTDAGFEKDFIRVDSFNSEQVWGEIETLVPAALRAAREAMVLEQPDQLQVLRQTVALHFARSFTTLNVVERTWPANRVRIMRRLEERGARRISEAIERRYGRPATRQEIAETIENAARTGVDKAVQSGAYARIRIEQLYDQALERFESWGVEVIRAPDNDLVITDNPVVLARSGDDRRSGDNRMAIDEAHSIAFPFAPDVLISMGPKSGYGVANAEAVEALNRSQIAGAHRFVFHREGQEIADLIVGETRYPTTGPTS
jgi:hypothetical protein